MTDYERPGYSELLARVSADLQVVPAALRGPLSAALARASHGQHGYLEWIDAQCSPLTCELERLYDWAELYAVDRLMATAASGKVSATGANGTKLLADTLLRGSNGLDYKVSLAVVLGDGSTSVDVRCVKTGTEGNLASGQPLTLIDPVPGCDNTMTVDANGLTGGAGDELVDNWRGRVAEEWQIVVTRGARSGKPDDYRFWAKGAHPSVTTALVQPHVLGKGTVVVRPICNTLQDRKPTQAISNAVSAHLYKMVPATADWSVHDPIKKGITVNIHLMEGYDTQGNRTAIEGAVGAAVLLEASESSVLTVAEINGAIATVTSQYTLNAPTENIQVAAGEVMVLEPIVWS
uniref:Uncharacterized phage protein gp47/JayE n=1 Tax=Candidatus Kentrum sp. LFY TaxID=2126342 RepID=A0A450UEC3_9GAMM|nr:MAG: Uncharacterized phage protein gp47/JayE [Candidatus Kentron sp. LFY]